MQIINMRIGLLICACILSLAAPVPGRAEEMPAENKNGIPDKEEDRASVMALLEYSVMPVELRDRRLARHTLRYMRDRELYAGAKASWDGFALGARAGVWDSSRPGRRRMDDFDLAASYFSRAFGAEASYRRYGRYRIGASPYGIARLWNDMNIGARMKAESAGATVYLFMRNLMSLNKDYSYRAAYDLSERQGKSGGAFVVLAGADYQMVRSNVPVLPPYSHRLLMYLNLPGMRGWRFIGCSAGIGFAGTLVMPLGFFISPMIWLTVHPFQMEFFTMAGTTKDFRIDSLRGGGRINAGYSGANFFAGLLVSFEGIISPAYRFRAEVWTGDLNVRVFSGVRI
jgi:hypothetical protein